MALTTQQREDVYRFIEDDAASSPAKTALRLRALYDLIFATNAQRAAALQAFLDDLIAKANADITAHDAGAAAGKTAKEAYRDALTTLRNAV